ncbi:MAG: ImmA/IrrE family metallo-endopeptidase [Synechococcaceae cyanobacterium SM1_2_3]|nr:ImmA/IrrE family metallo-endopeptidase [Synechococcaceae cyanobacterium SM1_2_3]
MLEQVERYLMIEAILELDSACWNHPLPDPERRVMSDVTECETLAEQVRMQWNLGLDPIPNLTQLLEQHGIKVLLLPLPAGVYGLTCLVQRPEREAVPCIVVNRAATLERRRLTLAHELGHRLIDDTSPAGAEAAAKHFASAFLMPAASVRQDFGNHRHAISPPELMPVKRGYRVSAAALLVRCERLDILSHSGLGLRLPDLRQGLAHGGTGTAGTARSGGNTGSAGTV